MSDYVPLADWRDPRSYDYTRELTRDGWAWEFLRRNPAYRMSWDHFGHARRRRETEAKAAEFGLLVFEDPARAAMHAPIFWHPDISSFVLPVRAERGSNAAGVATVDFGALRARAASEHREGLLHHLLFQEAGRRLQLVVHGERPDGVVSLLTEAPLDPVSFRRRMSLLQRLADLLANGRLTPQLYPPEARARRLAMVLRALDGWLAKSPQRAIGQAMFDRPTADEDWRDCECPLRERVRLTLRRARWLMEDGYRSLLQ
jgi:hypothetical protein